MGIGERKRLVNRNQTSKQLNIAVDKPFIELISVTLHFEEGPLHRLDCLPMLLKTRWCW